MTTQEHLQKLYDLVAELQGHVMANSVMIEALLTAHPDQASLRAAWGRLSSAHHAEAAYLAATKNRMMDRAMEAYLSNWTVKLERREENG